MQVLIYILYLCLLSGIFGAKYLLLALKRILHFGTLLLLAWNLLYFGNC